MDARRNGCNRGEDPGGGQCPGVGQKRALKLTELCQPIGVHTAREIGFIDDAFGDDAGSFEAELRERAARLAEDPQFRGMLRRKHQRRLDDEYPKPLASYRAEELDRMKINFFGQDQPYHEARRRFVFNGKEPRRERRLPVPATLEQLKSVLSPAQSSVRLTELGLAASIDQSRRSAPIIRASS